MDKLAKEMVSRETSVSETEAKRRGGIIEFLKRNLTPRLGTALVLWRVEAYLAVPVALALVATIGRWPAALAMGSVLAIWSALFLFLLDGQNVLEELREWAYGRRFSRRYLRPLAERRDLVGSAQRLLSIPAVVLFIGPFWRAVTLHLFRAPKAAAYVITVGGSIPHSLLWTGVVLGGLWEGLVWPFLDSHWF